MLCDEDPSATVVSVDGIGAYDHIYRAAMLDKLSQLPTASAILPFVRLAYAQPSQYMWSDDEGVTHWIAQGDGGEQGDPLMPLLFTFGIRDALAEVQRLLLPGERLCAFLDDVYVVCKPERARAVYDLLSRTLEEMAGIQTHLGKTRVWNRQGGDAPPGIAELGAGLWSRKRLRCWALLWVQTSLLPNTFADEFKKSSVFGMLFFIFPTSSARGCCCCSVRARVATTCCGLCRLRSLPPTQPRMTRGWRPLLGSYLA